MQKWMRRGRTGGLILIGVGLAAYSLGMGIYSVASTRPKVPSQPVSIAEAEAALAQLGISDAYPFRNGFVGTPHGRMHYAAQGKGDPVLFLHGNPTWSFLYRDVMRELGDDWRVVAPDLIGFGLSEKLERPEDYSVEGHIEDVSALVETLDLRNLTLVVQDWGGPIGLGVWLRHPQRVRGLVVMNTYGFSLGTPGKSPADELVLRFARAPVMGEQLVQGLGWVQRSLLRSAVAEPAADAERVLDAYLEVQGSWPERAGVLAFSRRIPATRADPLARLMSDARAELARQPLPALVVWGMRDRVRDRSVLDEWREVLPDARVVELEQVGPLPPEESPLEVATELRAFLESAQTEERSQSALAARTVGAHR